MATASKHLVESLVTDPRLTIGLKVGYLGFRILGLRLKVLG